MFHTRKIKTFEHHFTLLKQDLKATSEKLRYKNKLLQRKGIKNQFNRNPKSVYCQIRGYNTAIRVPPNQNDVETFWRKIWGKSKEFNRNASWVSKLEKSYCANVNPRGYIIDDRTILNTIKRLQNGKAPGKDYILRYWYKPLSFNKQNFTKLMNEVFIENRQLAIQLLLTKTKLIPENNIANMAKNYRPIACQNIIYKTYTGCGNVHLQDSCENNSIITNQHVAGLCRTTPNQQNDPL